MAIQKPRFHKGIILRPDTVALDSIEGELKVDSADSKIKAYLGGSAREIVTTNQSQTLTNKTIVVASSTITTAASGNLAATELNAALAELQSDIDTRATSTALTDHINDATDAHDASAISNVPAGNLAATDVQGALNELQGDINTNATAISDHIADATDAHDASAISNAPSGNLAATDVQGALNELQTDIDTRAAGAASSTDNHLARFDGTTGKILQDGSTAVLSDAGGLTGLTYAEVDSLTFNGNDINTLSNADLVFNANGTGKIYSNKRHQFGNQINFITTTDAATGSNASLSTVSNGIVRLTDSGLVSIDTIPAGNEGQLVTLINATGNTITINDNTGATAANRILTGQKAAITLKDEASIALEYDPTEQRWMVIGGTGSSAASDGNYFSANPDAEAGTAGFITYDDGASTSPVDGTGGTVSCTLTSSSSSPIHGLKSFLFSKDAANRQGEGASYAITLDSGDQAKPLMFSMDYTTTSGYADGYMRLYLIDVTNGTVIEGSQRDIPAVANNGTFVTWFQTPSNSTSYKVAWHVADSSSTAWDIKFDKIFFGQKSVIKGPIVTDWISFTPTGVWNTNVSYLGKYRRVGDCAEIEYYITASGTPTGTCTLDLPTGLVIDTTKLVGFSSTSYNLDGMGLYRDVTVANYPLTCRYASTTTFNLRYLDDGAAGVIENGNLTATAPATVVSGDFVEAKIKVPIVGWGSNVTLSEDTGNRVVAFKCSLVAAANHTSAGGFQKVPIDTVIYDTAGGWDAVNTRWVAPESGYYWLSASVRFNTISDTKAAEANIYVNGSVAVRGSFVPHGASGGAIAYAQGVQYLNKGDYVENYAVQDDSASEPYLNTTQSNNISGFKIQSPQSIGMSEVVAVQAYDNAGDVIGTGGNDIIFTTVFTDTHNAYNNSTGVFTAPHGAYYSITWTVTTASVAFTTSNRFQTQCLLELSASSPDYLGHSYWGDGNGTSQAKVSGGCIFIWMDKGNTFKITATSSVATTATTTGGNIFLSVLSR